MEIVNNISFQTLKLVQIIILINQIINMLENHYQSYRILIMDSNQISYIK